MPYFISLIYQMSVMDLIPSFKADVDSASDNFYFEYFYRI